MNDTNVSKDPGLRALIERFPRLFRGAQPVIWSHVPAGWTAIVETLFSGIDALLSDEEAGWFPRGEVKEKFGTLLVYGSFNRIDPAGVNPEP